MKDVRQALYQYKGMKASFALLNDRLNEILLMKNETLDNLKAALVKETLTSQTNKTGDPTYEAVDRAIRLYGQESERIQREMENIAGDIIDIETALTTSGLTDIELRILKYRYFDNRNWTWIAMNVNYSEPQCKRMRSKGIMKMEQNKR
jgi:DNA-directed RNA polymerase specialized sigma subunit